MNEYLSSYYKTKWDIEIANQTIMKSSQPQQDSSSLNLFFFFWRWGICILANFSLSLFITGTLQTNSVSLIETHFTYTISHSIPFLLVKDFECERLFLAILRQTKIIWFLIQVLHYKFLNPIVVVIAQRTHTHTHTKVNLYTKSTSYISSPFFFI